MKRILVGAAAASLLMAGSAFAGTLTYKTVSAWTVAQELVEASTNTLTGGVAAFKTSSAANLQALRYKPTDITLGTLTEGTLSLVLNNGSFDVSGFGAALAGDGTGINICEALVDTPADGDVLVASLKAVASAGTGTNNNLIFDKGSAGSGSVTNGRYYYLSKADNKIAGKCGSVGNGSGAVNALAAGDVKIAIPQGTASISLTANLGISTSQTVYDTANRSVVSVLPQYSLSITQKADAKISPADSFKLFTSTHATPSNTKKEEIKVTLLTDQATALNHNADSKANSGSKDNLKVTVKLSDGSAIKSGSATMTDSKVTGATQTCTIATDKKSIECVANTSATLITSGKTNNDFTIGFEVDGTSAINERNFTATAALDFDSNDVKGKTFFTDADAGNWSYDAATLYLPVLRTNGLADDLNETYIRIFSTDTTANANGISAVVYDDNGALPTTVKCTSNSNLATVPSNSNKGGCLILGSDLYNSAKATGSFASQTGASVNFPAKFVVIANPANVYGYATQVVNGTTQRRVPLYTNNGGGATDSKADK